MNRWFLGCAAVLTTLATAPVASACMRETMRLEQVEGTNPAAEMSKADTALDKGDGYTAAMTVAKTYPNIKTIVAGTVPLENRALRVMALAIVRSNGGLTAGPFKGAESGANITWAINSLRALNANRPNDASLKADLGEALARSSASKPEALKILSDLAKQDLIGSPRALAALAKLKSESGDADGAREAVTKCKSMTKSTGICEAGVPITPAVKVGTQVSSRS